MAMSKIKLTELQRKTLTHIKLAIGSYQRQILSRKAELERALGRTGLSASEWVSVFTLIRGHGISMHKIKDLIKKGYLEPRNFELEVKVAGTNPASNFDEVVG